MQLITNLWFGNQDSDNTGQIQQPSDASKEQNQEKELVPHNTQECLTIATNAFKSDVNTSIPPKLNKVVSRKGGETLPQEAQQDTETDPTVTSSNFPPKLKGKEKKYKQQSFYIDTFRNKLNSEGGANEAFNYHKNTKKESFSPSYLKQALPDMWKINQKRAVDMTLSDIESFNDLQKKKDIVKNAISGIFSRFGTDEVITFVSGLLEKLPNTQRPEVSAKQQVFGEKIIWNREDTILATVFVLKGKDTDSIGIKQQNAYEVLRFAKEIKSHFDVLPEDFVEQVKSLLENRGLTKEVEAFMNWANPQNK